MRETQEIFETAVTNLLRQNAKCGEPNGVCYYKRGDKHCGVGGTLLWNKILELYPDFEDLRSNFLAVHEEALEPILLLSEIDIDDRTIMGMLADMQTVHDDNPVDDWRQMLVELGVKYDLNTDFIREIK